MVTEKKKKKIKKEKDEKQHPAIAKAMNDPNISVEGKNAINEVFGNAPSVPYKTPPKKPTKKAWGKKKYWGTKNSEWKEKYLALLEKWNHLTD